MTLDVLTDDRAAGSVGVIDWKFARWDFDPEPYRAQLEINALAAASEAGVDRASVAIGVVSESGAIGFHRWDLDGPRLVAVAARVRRAAERVLDERAARARHGDAYRPDVRQGAHCRYCPAWLSCWAKRDTVALFVPGTLGGGPTAPGDAYVRLTETERACEATREALRERLALMGDGGQLPTGDGREVVLNGKGHLKLRRVQ
jgi:hypothetical protein